MNNIPQLSFKKKSKGLLEDNLIKKNAHNTVFFPQNERYLNKKRTAKEMEQLYQGKSSVDYSLKEGQTLVLYIKNVSSLCFSVLCFLLLFSIVQTHDEVL